MAWISEFRCQGQPYPDNLNYTWEPLTGHTALDSPSKPLRWEYVAYYLLTVSAWGTRNKAAIEDRLLTDI